MMQTKLSKSVMSQWTQKMNDEQHCLKWFVYHKLIITKTHIIIIFLIIIIRLGIIWSSWIICYFNTNFKTNKIIPPKIIHYIVFTNLTHVSLNKWIQLIQVFKRSACSTCLHHFFTVCGHFYKNDRAILNGLDLTNQSKNATNKPVEILQTG